MKKVATEFTAQKLGIDFFCPLTTEEIYQQVCSGKVRIYKIEQISAPANPVEKEIKNGKS